MILDRMVPGIDGLGVMKALRGAGIRTPALFLTAMDNVDDRVEGLEAGADDYLPKPFAGIRTSGACRCAGAPAAAGGDRHPADGR